MTTEQNDVLRTTAKLARLYKEYEDSARVVNSIAAARRHETSACIHDICPEEQPIFDRHDVLRGKYEEEFDRVKHEQGLQIARRHLKVLNIAGV